MGDLWKGPNFIEVDAGENDMNIASIAWGISLGVGLFTFVKGMRQTIKSWRRGRRMNHYIILLWLEWTSSCIMSAVTWCYLRNYIPGGFPVFFTLSMLSCYAEDVPEAGTNGVQFSFGVSNFKHSFKSSLTESQSSWSTDRTQNDSKYTLSLSYYASMSASSQFGSQRGCKLTRPGSTSTKSGIESRKSSF
jgi:hypothetical protein